jgi:tetratricopeptide (TPR) repeat protein
LYDSKGDFANAEADYKKAIELRPEYLDANFWLANLYFKKAGALIKAASSKSNDEFDRAKKESDGLFKTAAPYFEKALEINPKKTDEEKNLFKDTLTMLKQLYVRINETEKYNKVKAMLEQN